MKAYSSSSSTDVRIDVNSEVQQKPSVSIPMVSRASRSYKVPFAKEEAFEAGVGSDCHEKLNTDLEFLPGHPRVALSGYTDVTSFLEKEFCSCLMERISPFLWVMSFQSHTNISPLHRQKIKGRTIIVTEDPKLHLVWYHDRIFLKPLPLYLCSYDVWYRVFSAEKLTQDPKRRKIRAAALGYLRTWFYLIQHESDFRIAQTPELQLVPKGMCWETFCRFSARLYQIEDPQVTERYHFGEIRLTRLNFYSKILLRQWAYQRMHGQYGDYFAQFYTPLLFIFAIVSVTLSGMQLVISVEQVSSANWQAFWGIARWSGVTCAIAMLLSTLGLTGLLFYKVCAEWKVALRDRWRQPRMQKLACGDLER